MEIELIEATINDSEKIHQMQKVGFKALLEKYQDYDTNPGAETLEKIKWRFQFPQGRHYFIEVDKISIGYIRIVKNNEHSIRLSQMFILPDYQGRGYAQQVIKKIEMLNPNVQYWELDTIKQESKLCYLYEKMGYKPTGKEEDIKDGMTLIYYEKRRVV